MNQETKELIALAAKAYGITGEWKSDEFFPVNSGLEHTRLQRFDNSHNNDPATSLAWATLRVAAEIGRNIE